MKNILISGASRGIGEAIATNFAGKGYNLGLLARSKSDLEKLNQKLGNKHLILVTDITKEEEIKEASNLFLEKFGQIDVLVNNAGIGLFREVEKIDLEEWDKLMNVNVRGTFLLCKELIPQFKTQKMGHIISIISDVAKRTFAQGSLYCASKFAQDAFLSSTRSELRPFGVKVSNIYPGLTDTYFNDATPNQPNKAKYLKATDIANAVDYTLHTPANVVVDELILHPLFQEY